MSNLLGYGSPAYGANNLAATGTTQATALLLPAAINVFATVASGAGCILPFVPCEITVINNGANALLIYPPGGDTINGGTANAAVSLPAGQQVTLAWIGNLTDPAPRNWVTVGTPFLNGGTVSGNLSVTGLLYQSAATVSAAGNSQATATALSSELNFVTAASAGQGVALMPAVAGLDAYVTNLTSVPIQVYGNGTDTIDANAGSVGVAQMVKSSVIFSCANTGTWVSNGLSTGYSPSGLQTVQPSDAVTAAGTGQSTATQLTGLVNTVSTVASGTGVNLPQSSAGLQVTVQNTGANALQVYPFKGASDTINGVAAGTGVSLPSGAVATFNCTAAGAWTESGSASPTMDAYNANAATSGTTLTAANITGGQASVTLALTGTLGAGANAQLPTVASVTALLHNPQPSTSYRLRVINESGAAFAWTVTTNTGWTLTGTMSIAQNTWREFDVRFTSLAAATLQNVGTGTFS